MAKVMLICGKIGSGKTQYAKSFINTLPAVLLSVDEITLALFGQNAGEHHDFIVEKTEQYLFAKSLEMIKAGMHVILDWGFWTHEERKAATAFYKQNDVAVEWHYMNVSDGKLRENLNKRNREVEKGQTLFYLFDDNFANQFWNMFEIPDKNEIDVWVTVE